MQELDFALDGVTASSVGIHLQRPVSFSAAVPRVDNITIPGRSGDLHYIDGAYKNRTGTASCFALDGINVTERMGEIMGFLFGNNELGYRKLTVSEDKTHYWQARISNAGEIAPRLNRLNPFTIEFDCKPFRVLTGYDELIEITSTDFQIANPTGFIAYPMLYITSASTGGAIDTVDGRIKFVHAVSNLKIDCEEWRVYSGSGSSSDGAVSSSAFPYIGLGKPHIYSSGVTFSILPRWRTL